MSRTLVLLHGVASNSTRWAEFRETTRLEHWDIATPDLRGNASAAAPRTPLGMEVWCADIAALLDARGAWSAATAWEPTSLCSSPHVIRIASPRSF